MKHFSDALIAEYLLTEAIQINEANNISLKNTHDSILKRWGDDYPKKGCIFITPEGQFLNLYPLLLDHNRLCDWVNKNGLGPVTGDATWFTDKLNYIRCRNDAGMCYIVLTETVTSKQLFAIQEWLEQDMEHDTIVINVPGAKFETYKLTEYFPEDLIKIIRRYYSSGRLMK